MSAFFPWLIPGVVTLNAWANRHIRWKWGTLWKVFSWLCEHSSEWFFCGKKKANQNKTILPQSVWSLNMTPGGSLFITAGFSFHPSFIGLFYFSPEQSLLDWAIAGLVDRTTHIFLDLCLVCTVVLEQKKVFFGQKDFLAHFIYGIDKSKHLWRLLGNRLLSQLLSPNLGLWARKFHESLGSRTSYHNTQLMIRRVYHVA